MRITAFAALAILAHGALALPVQSSMPLEKDSRDIQKHQIEDLPPISTFVTSGGIIEIAPANPIETTSTGLPFNSHPEDLENFPTVVDDIPDDGPKSETNTTFLAQHSSRPISQPAEGGYKVTYNNTDIETLLSDLLSKYNQHESKYSKRWVPQLDVVSKALNRFKPHNSTIPSDDEKVQLIINQLELDLRSSRASSYKYSSPQRELAAIHKAEDRLRALNVTRDASLRYSEKLRDDCYKIHGSRHRQEACAREVKEKVTEPTSHNQLSWNSTALMGKRATTKDVSNKFAASQAVQEASPSLIRQQAPVRMPVYQVTMAHCPGESEWFPAEQFEDVSSCALKTYQLKPSHLERRDDDPTPDPVWLNKFLFPAQDNSLPKRNEKRWEFEGFGNVEYDDPDTHETTEFDIEADFFSDWMRSHGAKDEDRSISHTNSSTKHPTKRDLADQVRKLENEMEAKIARPFIEFKNATEDATDAIQDAVERFTARIQKHKSKMPGKMNTTATFDPSKERKRGLPESVRKVKNQLGSKITEVLPFAELKNSTKRRLNATEKIYETLYKDEGFKKYLRDQLSDTNDRSTTQGFMLKGKLLDTLSKDEDIRNFLENLPDTASTLYNSTQCTPFNSYNRTLSSTKPRVHAREIQQSGGNHGNCQDGVETLDKAFSKSSNNYWFDKTDEEWEKKHRKGWEMKPNIKTLPNEDEWISPKEEEKMVKHMIKELKEDMKNPKNKWYIPEDKAVY